MATGADMAESGRENEHKIYTAAIIGCGRMGYSLGLDKKREQPASHTMALQENPRIKIVAGCDKSIVAIKQWHNANRGTKVYRSSCAMYRSGYNFDIITVAVNEDSHCIEAIDAIISTPRLVILEKPVALNISQALLIQQTAKAHNVPVLINHERRFAVDYAMALSLLGTIGPLQSIHATLCSSLCVYNPKEEISGNYSLIHDGTHLVDIVLFFLENGTPSSITGTNKYKNEGLLSRAMRMLGQSENYQNTLLHAPILTGVFRDKDGNVRQLNAHYTTEQCPDVTISISGRSRYFSFGVEITGTEGRICIGNGFFKVYRRSESNLYTGFYSLMPDESIVPPTKTLYMSNMVQNAVDFLDGKCELKSTLQTGINALAVLEEIKKQL